MRQAPLRLSAGCLCPLSDADPADVALIYLRNHLHPVGLPHVGDAALAHGFGGVWHGSPAPGRPAASAPPTALVPLCCVRGPPTRVAHPAGRVAHPKDALRDACDLLSLQIRLEAKDLRPPGGNLSRFCPSADLGQPRLGDPHLLPGLQHCILQAIVGIQNGDHLTCLNAIARCPQSILYSVGDL